MVKHITFREGRIRYSDTGTGRAVVFLHGFLESLEMWQYYVRRLKGYRRIICIDLPGHGKSGNFGYVHDMELMADAVQAVLHAMQIRKCIMVGHSMGGYVSLAFAERYPDYLHGIVMFFSTARADSATKKKDRNRAIKLVKQNHKSFIRSTLPMLFAEQNRKKYKRRISTLIKRAEHMTPQGIVDALEGMKNRPDREVILQFSPFPILFVAGQNDPVIPLETVQAQVAQSANCTLAVIPEIGHMGFIENKQLSLAVVRKFVNRIFRNIYPGE